MNPIHTYEYSHEGNARRILIVPDPSPLDPREDPPELTHLCLKHRRYSLPCEEKLPGWNPSQPWVSPLLGVILLPVWGYDHSGLSLKAGDRTYPFDCPWDSGLLGYIWARKSSFPELSDLQIADVLSDEVSLYSKYLNGENYGYVIEELATFSNPVFGDREDWVAVDSCYGYYSVEEAKDAAESQKFVPSGGL